MIKKMILPFFLFLMISPVVAFAGTVHSSSGQGFSNLPTYDSSKDGYVINISNSVQSVKSTIYSNGAGSDVYESNTFSVVGVSNPRLVLRCNAYHNIDFLNGSAVVGNIKFTGNQIKNPNCSLPSNDDGNGGSNGGCSTAICECINQLKSVNSSIRDAINSNGQTLSAINANLGNANSKLDGIKSALGTVNDSINSFADQFKTGKNYSVKDMPDTSGLLDKNKPAQPTKPFEDKNKYFSDQGDAKTPGKLPSAPDPTDNWDGVKKEPDGTPDKEMDKDKELKKDDELKKDEYEKDKEMVKDEIHKDKEMEKDREPTRDHFEKDDQLGKDHFEIDKEMKKDSFDRDPVYKKDHFDQTERFDNNYEFERNHFYEQTNQFWR